MARIQTSRSGKRIVPEPLNSAETTRILKAGLEKLGVKPSSFGQIRFGSAGKNPSRRRPS